MTLPETATTGYRWHPDADESALRPIADTIEAPTMPRGAAGSRMVAFEVVRPGNLRLRLLKQRAWESSAVEEFTVELEAIAGEG